MWTAALAFFMLFALSHPLRAHSSKPGEAFEQVLTFARR